MAGQGADEEGALWAHQPEVQPGPGEGCSGRASGDTCGMFTDSEQKADDGVASVLLQCCMECEVLV